MSERYSLLIIDDDNVCRTNLKGLFDTDFTVIESTISEQAFQLLLDEISHISLAIINCSSNSCGGFRLLQQIKTAPLLSNLPVVVLLDKNDSDGCLKAINQGAADVIGIPYVDILIRRRISSIIQSSFTRVTSQKLLLQEQEFISEIHYALTSSQFVIYLQPVYSISAQEAVSAEALIRWIHPEKGLIPPGSFISLFEKTGFITKLDRYVWEKVCSYISENLKNHKTVLPISVNISRVSLKESCVCDDIIALTQKYDIPPSLLRFEITESAYTDNPSLLLKTLAELHNAGFIIMMDDFGSGYSSLNMLKEMPVDVLKIDMCFLGGFETSAKAGNILTSVVRMAKWLNIPVIAEGVESKTQLDFLRSIGCDRIQGYYFSKPLPISEFELKIKQHTQVIARDSLPIIFEDSDFDTLFNGNHLTSKLFNSVIGAIGIYEFTGENFEVIRVNDNYYDIFGYNPQTFYEATSLVLSKVFPEDHDILIAACSRAIQGDEVPELTIRRYHANGNLLSISIKIKYLGGTEDHPIICIAMNDISEKKADEQKIILQQEALKKHNDFLQSQYDSVPSGVVLFTVEDEPQITSFNAACVRIFGFTDKSQFENLCKPSVINMIHPDDHIYFSNILNKRFYSDSAIYYEARIIKADDSIGYINGAIDLIETPEGNSQFQTVFMDVTEEKRFESEKMLTKYSAALFTQFDQIFEFNYEKHIVTQIETNGSRSVMPEKTMYIDKALSSFITRYVHQSYKTLVFQFFKNIEIQVNIHNQFSENVMSLEFRRKCDDGIIWNRITVIPVSEKLYLVCNIDISASKNAQLLHEQNIQLQIKQREHETIDTLMKNLPIGLGIFKISDDIQTLYISSKACEIYGYSHEEFIQKIGISKNIFYPYDKNETDTYFKKLHEKESFTTQFVFEATRADGEKIWIRIMSTSLLNSENEIIIYAAFSDITEERNEELKNEKRNALYKMLLEDTQPIIFDYDFEKDVMNYSVLLHDKTRENRIMYDYLQNLSNRSLIKKTSISEYQENFKQAFNKPGQGTHDFQANFFGHGYRWFRAKYISISDSSGKVVRIVGRATDVTDQIKYANRLKTKAEIDEMTGLYNHVSAEKQVNAVLRLQPESAAFFMIDVDNFKSINDNFGHPVGDRVLQRIANIIKDEFRADDIKGRMGGDEFAVFCIIPEDIEKINLKAENILKKSFKIASLEGLDTRISVSIGIATSPKHGTNFKSLFSAADIALYKSKSKGKAQFSIYSDQLDK